MWAYPRWSHNFRGVWPAESRFAATIDRPTGRQQQSGNWLILALAAFIAPVFASSIEYKARIHPDACSDIHLGEFTIPKDQGFIMVGSPEFNYELRSSSDTTLYIAAVSRHIGKQGFWYAPEKYAVDLSDPNRVRRITEKEWLTGVPLPSTHTGAGVFEDAGVRFRGRLFEKSGPLWFGKDERIDSARFDWVNESETRLAVMSWDGIDYWPETELFEISFERPKIKGRFWVDIYDTVSGQPLVRIQGSFHRAEPWAFLGGGGWYSDRFFLMPMGHMESSIQLRRLMLCDTDRADGGQHRLVSPSAVLTSFSDSTAPDVATGLIGVVSIIASMNVQTPGLYQLTLDLLGSNGNGVRGSGSAQLTGGPGQIPVPFRAVDLRRVGVDGPYAIENAHLKLITPHFANVADYVEHGGATQAYPLTGLSGPRLSLTGQYTATPSDTNGIPGYENLAVSAGISQQPTGYCQVDGALYAGTTLLDSASETQYYNPGATSVTLNFNGYRIHRAGLDGPYTLRNVRVICGSAEVSGDNLFQTPAYTAGQFESGTADFSLSAAASLTASSTKPAQIQVNIGRTAGFNQRIDFTLTGVPDGSSATLYFPAVFMTDSIKAAIRTTSTAPGSYPLTITGSSGALVHSVGFTLVVPATAPVTGVRP